MTAVLRKVAVLAVFALTLLGAACGDGEGDAVETTGGDEVVLTAADLLGPELPSPVSKALDGEVLTARSLSGGIALKECASDSSDSAEQAVTMGWAVAGVGLTAYLVDDQLGTAVCELAVDGESFSRCSLAMARSTDDPVALERSGGQMSVCGEADRRVGFLTASVPSGAAWLAIESANGWHVYPVAGRPWVRLVTADGIGPTPDRVEVISRALDADGNVLSEGVIAGSVAG